MLIILVNFFWPLLLSVLEFTDSDYLPLVSVHSSYWPRFLCEFFFFLTGETFLAMINPCSDKVRVCPSRCTIKHEVTHIILESTHCDYCDCNSNMKTGNLHIYFEHNPNLYTLWLLWCNQYILELQKLRLLFLLPKHDNRYSLNNWMQSFIRG